MATTPGARPPRPLPSRRPAPAPAKKKTPPLYYAIAGGALLLLIGGFALYMNSLFRTKEQLVRSTERVVESDRKLRTPAPEPEAPKPVPPAAKPPQPATPPVPKRVEGKLPLSLDYRNEQHRFHLRIPGGFLVQKSDDPDCLLQIAEFQGRMVVNVRLSTPPGSIAQGWDRYLSLLRSEYPSMFPGFTFGSSRTETSGGLPALYLAFTCKNAAGQLVGAAQYFVAAKDRMVVVSFNAPTLFDREHENLVKGVSDSVRLDQ